MQYERLENVMEQVIVFRIRTASKLIQLNHKKCFYFNVIRAPHALLLPTMSILYDRSSLSVWHWACIRVHDAIATTYNRLCTSFSLYQMDFVVYLNCLRSALNWNRNGLTIWPKYFEHIVRAHANIYILNNSKHLKRKKNVGFHSNNNHKMKGRKKKINCSLF